SQIRLPPKPVLTLVGCRDQWAEFGSAAQLDQEGIHLQWRHRAIPLLDSVLQQSHAHVFLATEDQEGSKEVLILAIGVNAEGGFHFLCEPIPIWTRRAVDTCGNDLPIAAIPGIPRLAFGNGDGFLRLPSPQKKEWNIPIGPVRAPVELD